MVQEDAVMEIGFSNEKYLEMQSKYIKDRISKFGGSFIWNSAESSSTIITLRASCRI